MDIKELYEMDYDFRRGGSLIGTVKVWLALNENNYKRAIESYEELKHKMLEYIKEEAKKGHDEKGLLEFLPALKAGIEFHFGKISETEYRDIVEQAYKKHKLLLKKLSKKSF